VAFLEKALPGPGCRRVGMGRDGEAGGEHCRRLLQPATLCGDRRQHVLAGRTIDQPRAGSALDVKRICTWVRLRDRISGRTLRVYNNHLYLTEQPRRTAARLILAHIAAGDPADAVLLTADFHASPSSPRPAALPRRRTGGQRGAGRQADLPVGTGLAWGASTASWSIRTGAYRNTTSWM